MSVLVKGLAMDFVRQGRENMAITSIWPASVRISISPNNIDSLLTALVNRVSGHRTQ